MGVTLQNNYIIQQFAALPSALCVLNHHRREFIQNKNTYEEKQQKKLGTTVFGPYYP